MAEGEEGTQLATRAAILILGVWTVSFVVDIFVRNYEPMLSLTPMALAASGFLFGGQFMKKRNGKPDPEEINP